MDKDIPEGRGSLPAGALDRGSQLRVVPEPTPGSAVPGRVVHCKREVFDVYIGRPSEFGNPFRVMGENTRASAIEQFEAYARRAVDTNPRARTAIASLYGKTLGCWCAPKACHGDVLLKLAAEIVAIDELAAEIDATSDDRGNR